MSETFKIKTKYISEQDVVLEYGEYGNGRVAIQLASVDGEPLCVATVNLPNADVPDGHVLIKNYSENEGILDALVKAGVIGEPIAEIPTGFVMVQVCPLLKYSENHKNED